MAASNALFWTSDGWDGHEYMIHKTRALLLKVPDHTHVSLLSKSFVKTLVITIQGVQAIIALISGFTNSSAAVEVTNIALDKIFFPLAVLGLVRLLAAPWLTEDYYYEEGTAASLSENTNEPISPMPHAARSGAHNYIQLEEGASLTKNPAIERTSPEAQTSAEITLAYTLSYTATPHVHFHPSRSFRGIISRVIFIIPVLFLWVISLVYMIPWGGSTGVYEVPTLLLLNSAYLFFLTMSLGTYTYYFIRGNSATTVIPCIVSMWYQMYTAVLGALGVLLIVFACIETRKTLCGTYTTWPANLTGNDAVTCRGQYMNSNISMGVGFGFATQRAPKAENFTMLPDGEFRIAKWDGLCIGTQGPSQYVQALNKTAEARRFAG
jgi:hypothetical protein